MAAPAPATDQGDPEQQAATFKRLYPDQYFARFVADGVRPDGRPLGRARATTIGLNAVTTADASALVKVCRQGDRGPSQLPDQSLGASNIPTQAYTAKRRGPTRWWTVVNGRMCRTLG